MNKLIAEDEVLDDLQLDGLMILQKKWGYKFSTDSVLLSDFVKLKPDDVYVDLCSGSGVVAILTKHKNKVKKVFAVEIQPELAEMCERTIKFNHLEGVKVLCINLNETHNQLGFESVDVISINPPYNQQGKTAENSQIAVATHEIFTDLSQICEECFKLLKFGGKLFMVHRADRLVDIFAYLRNNKLEPKVVRFVYPTSKKEPNLVLIEAKKGTKKGLKFMTPLIINNADGSETEEIKRIYNRKPKDLD